MVGKSAGLASNFSFPICCLASAQSSFLICKMCLRFVPLWMRMLWGCLGKCLLRECSYEPLSWSEEDGGSFRSSPSAWSYGTLCSMNWTTEIALPWGGSLGYDVLTSGSHWLSWRGGEARSLSSVKSSPPNNVEVTAVSWDMGAPAL